MAAQFGGLFGRNRKMGILPGDQPDYGMGDFPMGRPTGTPPYIPQQGLGQIGGVATPENQQAPKQGGGFFGEGGAGRGIAGTIGDYLLQMNGMRPAYAPAMQDKAAQQRQQAQLEQARAWSNEDWQQRADYERANPKPTSPHYWETNDGSLGVIGQDGKPTIAYKDPTPKVNWVRAENGDGTFTMVPVGANGAMGQPPAELPTFTDDDWNNAGGAGGNASGGF